MSAVSLLTEEDRHRILVEWNNTEADYPRHLCLHQLFEAQVEKTPDALAAIFNGQEVTYRQLNEQANKLAHRLKSLGVGPGALVAVYMDRALEILPAVLGILKAGGAYVPLEPSFPTARIQWILAHLAIRWVVTQSTQLERLPVAEHLPLLEHVICLDAPALTAGAGWDTAQRQYWSRSHLEALPVENLPLQATAEDIAYVIFTSGSTGTPKGVVVRHRPVINLIHWVNTTFAIKPSDRILFVTSLCFDLSVYDIFGVLAAGGSIHIASSDDIRNPERLLALLYHEPITFWDSAPAALQQLTPFFPPPSLDHPVSQLRLVFLSGDWIPIKLPDRLRATFPGVSVVSLGGATEATIWSNYYCIGEVEPQWTSIPYGKPIQNARYYILDAQMRPCPIDGAGDLYIGGECLSSGYIHEPALTAEKFIPDPFSEKHEALMYKTGDQARFWADGTIEFLGRSDQQVKIRGFRVELGEIEATLSQHPALHESVVLAKAYADREKRLVAYLVPDRERAFPVCQFLRLEREGALAEQRLYELPNGMVIVHQNKNETDFVYNELFEEHLGSKYGMTLNEGDCIFDVGANIGLFSLLAAQHCKHATVYAFEPVPALFESLRLNTAIYGVRAILYNCGLSKTVGNETMTYYPHVSILSGRFADIQEERAAVKTFLLNQQSAPLSQNALSDEQLDALLTERLSHETIPCRMTTLSEVIREHTIQRIDLLKIDVEKSEQDVLDGIDEGDWQKIRQIMVEVYDSDGRLARITTLLESHGYMLHIEQEAALQSTRLYNIYATRAARQPRETPEDGARGPVYFSTQGLVRDVRQFLKERLPEYMLPSAFVLLETMPVTANGKLDRQALPDPDQGDTQMRLAHTLPRTVTEELIAAVWAGILGRKSIGVHENFFELGGHSLLATQAITRIRDIAQVDLPLNALFSSPTVAALAQIVEESQKSTVGETFRIHPVARTGSYPLSFSQEQIWFLQQLDPTNMAYHFQATLRFTGDLKIAIVEQSLTEIIRRHEIYRTTFEALEGRPRQMIHPAQPVALSVIDIRPLPPHLRAARTEQLVRAELQRPFDLTRLPLIRWLALRLDEHEYLLTHVEHHLVHDGWSFNTFLRELTILYRAFAAGEPSPLPELSVQFVDFACWQREWVKGEIAQQQLRYWTKMLAGGPALLQLPTDRPRPKVQTFRGNALRVELPLPLCAALRDCTRREGFTLFMLMFASFATLMHRYSGQDDICLGSGIANRRTRETEELIGMVINTLALRTDLSGNPTFRELVQRVREVMLGAYANQELPFEQVVEALQPERNPAYNPLFQVLFGFHDSPLSLAELPELQLQMTEGLSNGSAKFDMNLIVIPRAEQRTGSTQITGQEGITLVWEYNSDLFDETTIRRMIDHYQLLLAAISAQPEQHIDETPLLTPEEWQRIVVAWNETRRAYPHDQCVHRLVEAQVARAPDAVAVSFDEEALTYDELNRRANQLARYLQRLGLTPGARVGVYMEQSVDLIVALLAILKAGGAYVPFDLAYPKERIDFMLHDADVGLLLTQSSLLSHLPTSSAQAICLDADQQRIAQEESANLSCETGARSAAYVMYTSGSTGKPKGVVVPHLAINRLVCNSDYVSLHATDRIAQASNVSFDAATFEIWGALVQGAHLVGITKDILLAPRRFAAEIQARRISVLFLTTALFNQLAQEAPGAFHSLRYLLVGGEAADPRAFREVLQHGPPEQLLNAYGPTEGTTFSSWYRVQDVPPGATTIPIGRPVANTQIYLLDRYMQPVPIGVPGELYIGGDGLALEYLHRPELTAERFVRHPFDTAPDRRLYRSGDIARFVGGQGEPNLPDGAIEFIGRVDHQVKLRGFRIELGEIEAALAHHPTVREATVMLRKDPAGNKRLVAYIIALDNLPAPASVLRHFLLEHLPEYMVPASYIFLSAFPLTSNGKVDRRALPLPDANDLEHSAPLARQKEVGGQGPGVAPRTALEVAVAEVWGNVLGLSSVSVDDNFFELGGHSLLATQIIARIRDTLQVEIPLRTLFEYPTLSAFAEATEHVLRHGNQPSAPTITPRRRD